MTLRAKFDVPAAYKGLFEPHRYKIIYGGRGAGRSHSVARYLLLCAIRRPERILCTREYQTSIKDSVYKLFSDLIDELGLSSFFEILANGIRASNGSEFIFKGLQDMEGIKSTEGITKCWVEEAQNVSDFAWGKLLPTIFRRSNSEMIITFNPDLDDDPTYQRFVVNTPTDSWRLKANYTENPWFPESLETERLDDLQRDPISYRNIWLGECRQAVEGAILVNEIQQAEDSGRIREVSYSPNLPVDTYWDLGDSDMTAIWFVQKHGGEYRFIDFIQARRQKMPYYIQELKDRGYNYGSHHLPHDAEQDVVSASASIRKQLQDAVFSCNVLGKSVKIIPRIPKKALGINALRTVFPQCIFDRKNTYDGVQALRRWRYDVDAETGKTSKEPRHDDNSHAADAIMQFAQSINPHSQSYAERIKAYYG